MAVLATALFGIEELAAQLEEPFTVLPMQGKDEEYLRRIDEI